MGIRITSEVYKLNVDSVVCIAEVDYQVIRIDKNAFGEHVLWLQNITTDSENQRKFHMKIITDPHTPIENYG